MSKNKKKNKSKTNNLLINNIEEKVIINQSVYDESSSNLATKKEEFYCFNFKHITKNQNYNFEFFKKNKSNTLDAIKQIMNKLEYVSQIKVKDKGHGILERKMKFGQISKKYGESDFFDDMPLIKFRAGDYRVVCFSEDSDSNILYILAFDFDLSLYPH